MNHTLAAIYGIQEQVTKNVSSIFSKEDVFKLLKTIEHSAELDMDDTPAPDEKKDTRRPYSDLIELINKIKSAVEERIEEIDLGVSDIDYAQFECDGDRISVSEIEFDGTFKEEAYRDIIERIDQFWWEHLKDGE